MKEAIAKATTAKSFMPTAKEAIETGKDLGMIAGGMIAAHALVTMTKKDTAIVNGGIALAGLGVAMKAKSPLIKMLALGASAYGTIKLLNNLTKSVAAPETTEGLNGILPESAKALIRKFIPTLSGMDEISGAYEDLTGDSEIDGLSLDDFGMRGDDTTSVIEGMSGEEPFAVEGLGEVMSLIA